MNNPSSAHAGKIGYTIEAALEYLISILVTGSFLATLTAQIGLSDSLTGILSAIISLGCLFQLLSTLLRRTKSKRFVLVLSVLNQLLFLSLFFIPLLPCSPAWQAGLFTVAILGAYILYNFAHPKKIHWLMSLIPDDERGRFTAKKEIISLLSGILFSYGMGALIDRLRDSGRMPIALVICGGVVLVLTVAHTVTLLWIPDIPAPQTAKAAGLGSRMAGLAKNTRLRQVTLVFILWYIAQYTAIPFYGTYQIHELGFSLKTVSLLAIVTSGVRILFSTYWGRFADRTSFSAMMRRCLLVMCAAFGAAAFASPKTGLWAFLLYSVFSGIANAGINSALINLVYDFARPEQRADALALSQACAGTAGFLTTLCVSPLVERLQVVTLTLFGQRLYAQQLFSLLALVLTGLTALLVQRLAKAPLPQSNPQETQPVG